MTGSLTIIGSGIQAVRHFTLESCQVIEQADKVLYAVPDPITELYIKKIRPDAESLSDSYSEGKRRIKTYQEMKERGHSDMSGRGYTFVSFTMVTLVFLLSLHMNLLDRLAPKVLKLTCIRVSLLKTAYLLT